MRLGQLFSVILILLVRFQAEANAFRCEELFIQQSSVAAGNVVHLLLELQHLDAKDEFAAMLVSANRILALDPNNSYALRKKAKALIRQSRLTEAEAAVDALRVIDPNDIRALHMQGQILIRQFQFERALPGLRQLVELEPNQPSAVGMLSHTLFKLKRYAEALPYLDRRLAMDSEHAPSLSMKAQSLFKLQQYKEAVVFAEQLLKLEPDNYHVLVVQTESLLKLQRFNEALVVFDSRLIINPENIVFLHGKTFALFRLRRYQPAIVTADKLLSIDPENIFALSIKGQSLMRLRRYSEALPVLDARLVLEPRNTFALASKVQALIKLSRLNEAEVVAARMEEGFFKNYYSAQIFIARKQYQKAIALLNTLDSGMNVKWLLAQSYYLSGDMRQARQNLLFIVQNSKLPQLRVVAALIKIQLAGEQTTLDPLITQLQQRLSQQDLETVLDLKESLFWDYEPVSQGAAFSITNSFWNGLNALPVNSQTFNSTY